MTKWELFQVHKADSAFKNQSIESTILTGLKKKNQWI